MKSSRFHFIILTAAATLTLGECTPKSHTPTLWSLRADTSSRSLVLNFWDTERGYLDYDSALDTTFHYWPQAHGLDVLTDWYERSSDKEVLSIYDKWFEGVPAANEGGWWNPYYDDMEWHAIATLRAYNATGDKRFLEVSKELWENIEPAWNERGGGGMTWKKGMEWSKNACSNGPAAIAAAMLWQVLGEERYLQWAGRIYEWEKNTLFDEGAIYDNINGDTGRVAKLCLTYNQGTFIGAALELYRITSERSYIEDAIKAADYTLEKLSVDGILQNEGERDGGIFKGIFVRYFTRLILYGDLPDVTADRYVEFLTRNADTLWTQGKNDYRFGPDWRTPPPTPSAMTPQLSGCMLVEAMALLEKNGLLKQ